MFWQEEKQERETFRVPEDVVDVSFKVDCRSLPIDHALALSQALLDALPWLANESQAAIHTIHVAESGNGWIRPDEQDDILYLSRRTRMTLRLPRHRVEDALQLIGRTLDIGGNALTVGEHSIRKLAALGTVFARYVIAGDTDDETAFLQAAYRELLALDIKPRKMMPGKTRIIRTAEGPRATRSLMLAELQLDESIRLQERGIGPGRKIGCGIFLPHKGIEAVAKAPVEGSLPPAR